MTDELPHVPDVDLKHLIQSLRDILRLKQKISDHENQVNTWKLTITNLEQMVFNLMSAAGVQNLTIQHDDSVFNAYQKTQTFFSAKPDKKDKAYSWMKENNMGDLFKETVNSRSLNSALKELAEAGEHIPETLFNKFDRDSIGFKKGK